MTPTSPPIARRWAAGAAFVLATGAVGVLAGYWLGRVDGVALADGRNALATAAELRAIVDASKALTADANTASATLLDAMTKRAALDERTTKEFRRVLAKTAAARIDCRLDDDSVRHLAAARERAARAAAGGLGRAMPSTSGVSQP
ncbi:hypothetical protein [Pandoraea fibrosis]|uniref:hypothetical protein n=1 Tax=Pandoraea fibrosis TaxID=1891094 RepID=UPI001242C586|nr:hypothetical protein [Pandoraea fibrosis]